MVRRTHTSLVLRPRLGTVALLAMALAAGFGCSAAPATKSESSSSTDQFINVPLAAAPVFVKATGAVTITMADETAEVYLNAADSSLMVNGVQVVEVGTGVVAIGAGSTANVKTITISDATAATGDVLILNYVNGLFGQGKAAVGLTPAVVGTTVAFKAGKVNSFVLKGGPNGNNFAFGATGMTLNNAAAAPVKDVVVANASAYTAYLGAGNDKFTASGNAAIGGVFASPVTIYGGPGNDTLVEGTVSTPGETFSGGPGTDTVDYSARTLPVAVAIDPAGLITSGASPAGATAIAGAAEGDKILDADVINGGTAADLLAGYAAVAGVAILNGNAGDDVFYQGADTYFSGTDTINGGAGTDTVDYSLRTHSLTIVMDGSTASGDHLGNGGMGEKDKVGTDVENVKWGGAGSGAAVSSVTGNANANVFTPGLGTNTISGLAGDDTLVEGVDANATGNDTFNGGAGIDTVDYHLRTHAITVTMNGVFHGGDIGGGGTEVDIIGTDVENVYGGTANDVLTGNALDNDIEGNAGDDTLVGLGGNDTLVGASASGTAEANLVHGNDLADTAESGALNLCINIGSAGTPTSGSAPAAVTANCEVTQY